MITEQAESVRITCDVPASGILQSYPEADTLTDTSVYVLIPRSTQDNTLKSLVLMFLYTPAAGFTGMDTAYWTAECLRGSTVISTLAGIFLLRVIPNTPPEAAAANILCAAGTGIDIDLSRYITDTTVHTPDYVLKSVPAHGTIRYYPRNQQGSIENTAVVLDTGLQVSSPFWRYIPAPGYNGPDYFNWTAVELDTGTATVSLIINVGPNRIPVALPDTGIFLNALERAPLTLKFEDPDLFQVHSITVTSLPKRGLLEYQPAYRQYLDVLQNSPIPVSGQGGYSLYYTPVPGYTGRDTIRWCISDGQLISDTAVYTAHLRTNTPPELTDNEITCYPDGFDLHPAQYITDATPGTYRFVLEREPQHGVISIDHSMEPIMAGIPYHYYSSVNYVPDPFFHGADTILWKLYEGESYSNSAHCFISVNETQFTPLNGSGDSDHYAIVRPHTECYLDTYGGDDDSLSFNVITPPMNGSLEFRDDESWFTCLLDTFVTYPQNDYHRYSLYYTPDSGFTDADSFRWIATDNHTSTDTIVYRIFEDIVNTPPFAFDRSTVLHTYDTDVPLRLTYNDQQSRRGDSLRITVITQPGHGLLTVSDTLKYSPATGFAGADSFLWCVTDAFGEADTAIYRLSVAENTPPSVPTGPQPKNTWYNAAAVIQLTANDVDASQMIYFTVSALPSTGTLYGVTDGLYGPVITGTPMAENTVNAVNTPAAVMDLFYIPQPDFIGLDSIAWFVSDGMDTSATTWTRIDVLPRNAAQGFSFEMIQPPGIFVGHALPGPANIGRYKVTKAPEHASVEIRRDVCTITSAPHFTGTDSFICFDSDPAGNDTLHCRLLTHRKNSRGGQTVLIVADSVLHESLASEITRMRDDMRTEGYTVEIIVWPRTHRNTLLWSRFTECYHTPGSFMAGAVLIGRIPWGWDPGTGYVSDFPYWNMKSFDYTDSPDIWVSRISATDYDGTPYPYGSETELIRRALDANHAYRTGASRLPHTAFTAVYDSLGDQRIWDGSTYNYAENAGSVWPEVVPLFEGRTDPALLSVHGGDFFQSRGHGGHDGYWGIPLQMTTEHIFNTYSPVRACMIEACDAGAPGGAVNAHLFAKNGGTVIAIGAGATSTLNSFILLGDEPEQQTCRNRLAAGDSWGNALAGSFPFQLRDEVRPMYYGDLSLPVMQQPANTLPRVTELHADKLIGAAPLTVSFTAAADDPDGSVRRYAWYPEGYHAGMDDPAVANSTAHTFTYTYTEADTYLVRIEVCDDYLAYAYRELEVIVLPEGTAVTLPVTSAAALPAGIGRLYRLDGTVVRSPTRAGIYLYLDPENGVLVKRMVY